MLCCEYYNYYLTICLCSTVLFARSCAHTQILATIQRQDKPRLESYEDQNVLILVVCCQGCKGENFWKMFVDNSHLMYNGELWKILHCKTNFGNTGSTTGRNCNAAFHKPSRS
jgi:hypothetical protein